MNKQQFAETYEKVCKALNDYKLYVLAGKDEITILYPIHGQGSILSEIIGETLKDLDHKITVTPSEKKLVITFGGE